MEGRGKTIVRLTVSAMLLATCARPGSRVDTTTIPPPRWGAAVTEPRVAMDTVVLFDGRDSIRAYVARPHARGRHPAVIVLHANRITEPYIASTTAMLAEAGFVALAMDVFHFLPGNASWEEAQRISGDSVNATMAREFREPRLVRNVQAGIEYLRRQPDAGPGGVALLGFCGGGWNALLLAPQLQDVGAVVAFYAPVTSSDAQHRAPLELASYIRVPVLYQRPTSDQWVPVGDVERFEAALRAQGTPIERIDYTAAHGFFAWNRTGVFNTTEATRAWAATVRFLRAYAGRALQPRALAPARTSLGVPAHDGSAHLATMHVLHVGD